MNWNPTQPPKSDIAARFARTSDAERRIPSRTSGSGVRRSWTTNAEDHGGCRERAERPRRGPADARRLDEREDEEQHRRGHRHRAAEVEAATHARDRDVAGYEPG